MHRKLAETIPGPSTEEVARLARTLNIYVAFGMPELDAAEGSVYNSAGKP